MNQYIVRCLFRNNDGYQTIEFTVYAHSADDARVQTEVYRKVDSSFSGIQYIGPVNPKCECLNQCFCGTSAARK